MKIAITILLLAGGLAQAAEMGTVLRAAELKQKPFSDAAKVSDVAAKAAVEIVQRQGAWIQIKADGQVGWVKMLNVRTGNSQAKPGSGGGGLGSLVSVFQTGSSSKTQTTGVKGISKDGLKEAQPDMEQLAKLNGMQVTADDAKRFARAGKLEDVKVDYLPKSADGK